MCFFFNDTATTAIYTLSLPDALPLSSTGMMLLGVLAGSGLCALAGAFTGAMGTTGGGERKRKRRKARHKEESGMPGSAGKKKLGG